MNALVVARGFRLLDVKNNIEMMVMESVDADLLQDRDLTPTEKEQIILSRC